MSQLEEAKRTAEEETRLRNTVYSLTPPFPTLKSKFYICNWMIANNFRERQSLAAQVKNLEHENDNLRVHADEEAEVLPIKDYTCHSSILLFLIVAIHPKHLFLRSVVYG